MSTVLLPQSVSLYQASNAEPQYVTSQTPNRAAIYLDSQDVTLSPQSAVILMSTVKQLGEYPSNLAFGITRLSPDLVGMNWITPNVNVRNNTVTFFSSNSGLFHTVVIPERFYSSVTNIFNALVTALNTATGASGLTFSGGVVAGFPTTFTLNSAGGNYYFTLTSDAVLRGYSLYNLPTEQVATNSKTVGPMTGAYTRYIDVCSTALSQYLKVKNTSTGRANNIILRFYITDFFEPNIVGFGPNQLPDLSFNFLPNSPITVIDFELRDMFGDLLYVPPGAEGTTGGFWWNITITITI